MNCKKCNSALRPEVAAHSIQKIAVLCQASGVAPDLVEALARRHGPLCVTCLPKWGTDEDDLGPPTRRRSVK